MYSFEHNLHGSLIFTSTTLILSILVINFVDLARYSKDEYKSTMGDLVKYEDFVTEVSVTKQIRGGKLPARVYTIVIMEPDAINLEELEKMKKQNQVPQGAPPAPKPVEKNSGVPKK